MGFKEIVMYAILLFASFEGVTQDCGTIQRNTMEKTRKHFILDSTLSFSKIEELWSEIKPNDTAIIRQMIENGQKSEDYVSIFKDAGVSIEKIGLEEFKKLPSDSVQLTNKERRQYKKFKKLSQRHLDLLAAEKPTRSITRKLGKQKFIKLQNKLWASNSYLFQMYPIFHHRNDTLIMYRINWGRHGTGLIYEICGSN